MDQRSQKQIFVLDLGSYTKAVLLPLTENRGLMDKKKRTEQYNDQCIRPN